MRQSPILLRVALLALLALGGGRGAGAARETGAGGTIGCASSAFDTSTDLVAVALDPMTPAPLLTATLTHACAGPVYVQAALVGSLAPTGGQAAVVGAVATATCEGGGCPVTGVPIGPAPGGAAVLAEAAGQPTRLLTVSLLAVFPDLPPGTYSVVVAATGVHAQILTGQVQVLGAGAGPGGARPGGP